MHVLYAVESCPSLYLSCHVHPGCETPLVVLLKHQSDFGSVYFIPPVPLSPDSSWKETQYKDRCAVKRQVAAKNPKTQKNQFQPISRWPAGT